MKKKLLIYFAFIIGLLLWGGNVYALSNGTLTMFYKDDQGVTHSTNTIGNYSWGSYYVTYIDYAFGGGSFSSTANTLYAGISSGQGCTSNSCKVVGSFFEYMPYGAYLEHDLIVQLEQYNGVYKTCSLSNAVIYDTYFSKYDFVCYGSNTNGGFNIVFSNFDYSTSTSTYYGVSFGSFSITEEIGWGDLNANNNQNTQNIINNNNNNTQSIINNQNQNVGAVINNDNQNTQAIINNINNSSSQSEQELSGFLASWNNLLPTNGAISNLFLLPVNFLNAFIGSFNSTCQPFNLGNLFGHNIIFPCIDIQSIVGSSLYMSIDLLFSGLMIFTMIKKLILIWFEITSFKTNSIYELYGGGR